MKLRRHTDLGEPHGRAALATSAQPWEDEADLARLMDRGKPMTSSEAEYGGGLIDVSTWSLTDLDSLPPGPLAYALRRLDEAGSGPVAGFQSAL
ncbi:hypothetical protein GCM10020001_035870 [Nonomuraea salmonea]